MAYTISNLSTPTSRKSLLSRDNSRFPDFSQKITAADIATGALR
ncbi:hypothetical protein [Rhizobium mayense]|uniref:Uncharacterized protein n=1 Tax=Rhizobium mayense TaxID=1312184 RepID=A0ABT7JSX6_9HYPH|nr:hypothetical protein [Rhizobium mayense]MDL2399445.1 hypothetical protein [Rhizobium mayense]